MDFGITHGYCNSRSNARPERRGAEGVEMQPGRAVPRPLQAARWAWVCGSQSYLLDFKAKSLLLSSNLPPLSLATFKRAEHENRTGPCCLQACGKR
jgi:hypothetical protein